jgi:acyl-CoA synthetase (AMP-forming)/AMP-acid ligase II
LIEAASGAVMTYAELVARGAEIVAPMGPDKALLVVLARNDPGSVLAYAGALLGGHTVALLDAGAPIESTATIIRDYGARWVAGPAQVVDQLTSLGLHGRSRGDVGGLRLTELIGVSPPRLHPQLALLLSTSGTTGSRRFVRLSFANLDANATSIASMLELTPAERPVTSLPLHYTFGLSVLNSHWSVGAAVVLTDRSIVQPAFWDAARAHGCTSLAGVPFTFQILERVGFRDMDLPSLSTLQQAGGALDRKLTRIYHDHMSARGGRLVVMYGQTEATARIAWVPPSRLAEKLGSAGMAIPGGRLRIEPSESAVGLGDREAPPGVVAGEVVYEGPNVMLGYASGPGDLGRGDDLGGILRTGDIGYLDAEGFLFLVGRSKRIAKVFGVRINLDEVEAILRERGPAAVVGSADSIWAFCAFEDTAAADQARDELAHRFRLNRNALHVKAVDELPMAATGKIDYREVERWVRAT